MNIAIFFTIWSSKISSDEMSRHFGEAPLGWLKEQEPVKAVEIYTPEPGNVPVLDDIPAPTLILQVDLEDEAAGNALMNSADFQANVCDLGAFSEAIERSRLEITEAVQYPVGEQKDIAPRTSPLSFVVRYYGPVTDPQQFVNFYTRNHPPILAKFPNIRNVLCYLPLGWQDKDSFAEEELVIGNEVVFDDLDALLHSMTTPVLQEALDDADQFQPFGYSTHHAMHRELLFRR